jgi:putative membrane protein
MPRSCGARSSNGLAVETTSSEAGGADHTGAAGEDVVALPPSKLHPVSPFFSLIRYGRQLVVPLLLALVAGRDADVVQFVIAIPFVLASVAGFVGYLRFTYRIENGAVIVDEGIVTRKQRVVPLDRIQQVDTEAQLLHRVLGVVAVRLDTASGGQDADVTLSVVSRGDADRLTALLARRTRASGTPVQLDAPLPEPDAHHVDRDAHDHQDHHEDDREDEDVLLQLPPGDLAVAGVTGSRLLFALPLLGPLTELLEEVPETMLEGIGAAAESHSATIVAAVSVTLAALLWFGGAAIGSMLGYGGYTLRRRGRDLHVACGVLNRREATVAVDRVQAVRLHQNLVRRWIGRCSVHIQSGAVTGASTRLVIPIVRTSAVPELLAALLPGVDIPPTGALERAPAAARRRAIVRRVAPTAVAAVALVAVTRSPAAVVFTAVAVAAAVAAGELHYRGLGLAGTASAVVGRAGGLLRTTVVVPSARVQAVRVRSTPFQRRSHLATIELPVAGSGNTPTIHDQHVARAERVTADVLPATASDERRVRQARGDRPGPRDGAPRRPLPAP